MIKSYIRQDKCCETCAYLTEEGCKYDNNAQNDLDESTQKYGTQCPDWEHWPLNDDERKILELESEVRKLQTHKSNAQECLNRLRNELLGTDWYIPSPVGGNQGNEIVTDEIIKTYKKPKTLREKLQRISGRH